MENMEHPMKPPRSSSTPWPSLGIPVFLPALHLSEFKEEFLLFSLFPQILETGFDWICPPNPAGIHQGEMHPINNPGYSLEAFGRGRLGFLAIELLKTAVISLGSHLLQALWRPGLLLSIVKDGKLMLLFTKTP